MSPQHPESQEHQQHLPQRPRGTAGTGSMVPSQNHGMPGWEGTFKPTSFHPPAMGTFHQTRLLYLALNPSSAQPLWALVLTTLVVINIYLISHLNLHLQLFCLLIVLAPTKKSLFFP